jgi:hypothetical protein
MFHVEKNARVNSHVLQLMQRFSSDSDIELANHSALRFAGDIEGAWTALIFFVVVDV